MSGPTVFAWYLILSGSARFVVEFLRTNAPVVFGLTQPQLWALASIVGGAGLLALSIRHARRSSPQPGAAGVAPEALGTPDREATVVAR